MKMLMILSLVALVYGVAEGRLVSKCELKQELENADLKLSQLTKHKGMTDENFVARIVCHVEHSTGFNTSAFSQISPDNDGGVGGKRGKRSSLFSLAKYEARTTGPRIPRPTKPESVESVESAESVEEQGPVWSLYGLFQLSDHLVCTSGSTTSTSPNLCEIGCDAFLDDDITDDIGCLEMIKTKLESGLSGPHKEDFMRMVKILFQRQCYSVVASEYFADC